MSALPAGVCSYRRYRLKVGDISRLGFQVYTHTHSLQFPLLRAFSSAILCFYCLTLTTVAYIVELLRIYLLMLSWGCSSGTHLSSCSHWCTHCDLLVTSATDKLGQHVMIIKWGQRAGSVFILFIHWCHGAFRDLEQPPVAPTAGSTELFAGIKILWREKQHAVLGFFFLFLNNVKIVTSLSPSEAQTSQKPHFSLTRGCFITYEYMKLQL